VLYRLLRKFSHIIEDIRVTRFRRFGKARELVARISFKDGSTLHVKDYLFLNGERKYSYHWQNAGGDLLVRWDNSPHYPDLRTFPHHKHVGHRVVESTEVNLDAVLEFIATKIAGEDE